MHGETGSPRNVLVIEDDELAGSRLRSLLEASGFLVLLVTDARQALDRLRNGLAVDVILLDMILPGFDGWHFFDARRRGAILAAAPVIVMTGLGIASAEWACGLGAADFLRKPFCVDELLEKLRRHSGAAAFQADVRATDDVAARSGMDGSALHSKLLQSTSGLPPPQRP
jgi:CheY-like chemotaxis protein